MSFRRVVLYPGHWISSPGMENDLYIVCAYFVQKNQLFCSKSNSPIIIIEKAFLVSTEPGIWCDSSLLILSEGQLSG